VVHWVAQQLSSLFNGFHLGGFNIPPTAVVVILAALVVVVLVVLARQGGFRRAFRRDGKKSPTVTVTADDVGLAADAWLARAVTAEAAGDWREGVRCRYRSLIAVLVSAGAVSEEIGRTAGEYRKLVGGIVPDAAPAFGTATDTFEEACYGRVPVGPTERDTMVAAVGPVTEAARGYRRSRHRQDGPGSGSAAAVRDDLGDVPQTVGARSEP
jgi:hypothetical protein